MKNLMFAASLFLLTFMSYAGGPKNNSVKESIKTELYKSKFVEKSGMTGEVLVEFRVDASGKIIVEDSNSTNEELAKHFIQFVQALKLNSENASDQVYKMRFVFRKY